MKEQLWADQAKAVGIPASTLRQWWRGLRDNYGRVAKKGDSGLTERQEWIRQKLAFLKGNQRQRQRATAKSVSRRN